MKNIEYKQQAKTNRWPWILIILLCGIIGVQGYFLWQNHKENNFEETPMGLMQQDPFTQNFSLKDWEPFEEFQRMQKRMDQFFAKDFPNFERTLPPMKSFAFGGPFSQQFDLKEKDDRYILTLELPGLDETKLNVSVEEQTVKISGTMEQVEENKDKTSVVQSRRSSHFERYLTLPGPVKPESLQIDYDKNRLIIELDKA